MNRFRWNKYRLTCIYDIECRSSLTYHAVYMQICHMIQLWLGWQTYGHLIGLNWIIWPLFSDDYLATTCHRSKSVFLRRLSKWIPSLRPQPLGLSPVASKIWSNVMSQLLCYYHEANITFWTYHWYLDFLGNEQCKHFALKSIRTCWLVDNTLKMTKKKFLSYYLPFQLLFCELLWTSKKFNWDCWDCSVL